MIITKDLEDPSTEQEKELASLFQEYRKNNYFQSKSFGDYLHEKLNWNSKDWYLSLENNQYSRRELVSRSVCEMMSVVNIYSKVKFDRNFKPGVNFWDIAPLFSTIENITMLKDAIPFLINQKIESPTKIVAIESRGFWFAPYLAEYFNCGWCPVRKPGKLPRKVYQFEYQKEYGSDKLEIQTDQLTKDDQVLIVDDLIGTGGSLYASAELIKKTGARIVGAFLFGAIPIEVKYKFDFPVIIGIKPQEIKL